jgi:hypothetical protein
MMEAHSILAGKTYRTADGELRRVLRIDGDIVTFAAAVSTPGVIARQDDAKLPLSEFARQAEGEVTG